MEEKIHLTIDLLEIIKAYCDFNYDKTKEIPTIGSVIEIALKTQKELAREIDKKFLETQKEAV